MRGQPKPGSQQPPATVTLPLQLRPPQSDEPGQCLRCCVQEEEGPAQPQRKRVEEDPAQTCCALSGEEFERWFDQDNDKWYYEDAVVLRGGNGQGRRPAL